MDENNQENFLKYGVIVLIILCAIIAVIIISMLDFSKESSTEFEAKVDMVQETNTQKRNIIRDTSDIISDEDSENVKNVVELPEEITDTLLVNILTMKKYEANGIMKTENSTFQKTFSKTKMIYNFNYNPYNLEFIYPAEWQHSSTSLAGNVHAIQCSENAEGQNSTKAIITEINIEENLKLTDDNVLAILENKIREYTNQIGTIYEVSNVYIEEIEKANQIYKILAYDYNEGAYYKTHCFSMIKIKNPYMYILTVGIPEEVFNTETVEIKNDILKSFDISE